MASLQFSTVGKRTGWMKATAVCARLQRLGHVAAARKGPASCSPDDEKTVHCCTVETTEAAIAELRGATTETA